MRVTHFFVQLENAAKFRATAQRVGTYDEFKGIVDGCHLKPLAKGEDIDSVLKPNKHEWNTATNAEVGTPIYLTIILLVKPYRYPSFFTRTDVVSLRTRWRV